MLRVCPGRRSLAVVLCLSAFVVAIGRAAAQDETKAVVDWFDTLGYPDLSRAKLVRVATGVRGSSGGGPVTKYFKPAFLLKAEGRSFTVFNLGLNTWTYEQSPAGTPELERVGYEVLDLKTVVETYLKAQDSVKGRDARFVDCELRDGIGSLVVGVACYKQGLAKLAHGMLLQASSPMAGRDYPAKELRQRMIDAVGRDLLIRAVWRFGDPDATRKDLLAQFDRLLDRCPEGENPEGALRTPRLFELGRHGQAARFYRDRLRTMVKEDEEYARRPKKPEAEMSRRELIADLIWRLRDQESRHRSSLDRGQILEAGTGSAYYLVNIGFEAVPQLIEALDDERFARTFDSNRHVFRVLRVGDCARLIIERLAHRQFNVGPTPQVPEEWNKWAAESKKQVIAWWTEFQRKGERPSQ